MIDTVRIGHCALNYRISRSSEARPRSDEAAAASLRECLSSEMARLNGGEEDVWLIRTLRVRAVTNADWSQSQIASAIGRQISKALQKTLDAGPDGEEVLWFPNRSAYLGRFLADCSEGRAFGRWQYREFEKWSGLPLNAALREAIVAEPDMAREALANVLPGELSLILRQLTPGDSDKVFAAIAATDASEPGSLNAVLAAFQSLFSAGSLPNDRRDIALSLYLETLRNGVRPAPGIVRDVAALVATMQRLKPGPSRRFAALLVDGDFRGLVREFGPSALNDLASLVSWSPEERRLAVQAVADQFSGKAESTPEKLESQLGGTLLLLPLLGEFPWQTDGWPDLEETPAANVLRFLTILVALGQPRNQAAFGDGLLRFACGIPSDLDAARLSDWAESAPKSAIQRFRQDWLTSLYLRGAVRAQRFLLGRASRRQVAVDHSRGIWTYAETSRKRLIVRCQEWSPECSFEEGDETNVGTEWRYATLDPRFEFPKPLEAMLRLNAQALVREFAWRLPGFSRSSLPYLYENFLGFSATVDIEPERYLARVENPPLHLILSMNGMNRRSFFLPETGDRPWVITQRF
jgi:hypothetical protein